MYEINYTNVPEYFSDKHLDFYTQQFDNYINLKKIDITIKWFLINELAKCKNKSKFMRKLADEGMWIIIDNKKEKAFRSFEWIRKCYYNNLKDDIK